VTLDTGALFTANLPGKLEQARQSFHPTLADALDVLGLDRGYVRASGCHVLDAEGRRYLDFMSGFRVLNLGHNHPAVRQALTEAMTCDWPNMLQVDVSPLSGALASELTRRAPRGLDIVRFGNSGSEAVEIAIKFSRRATGRQTVLAARNAYHGLTYGALSLSGRPDLWHGGFTPMVPGCELVPFDDSPALEQRLARGDVAAFIVEPIQGEAGIVVPGDEYLPRAQELCRHYGTLFVLDEVQTGLGRTGRFLAAEHWHLEPDMVCLAKALSGGFVPVGATLMRRGIYERVCDNIDNCAIHFSTFEGNNLAMIAGLATLHVLDEERLIERSAQLGALLMQRLKELQDRHEFIAEVRGKGLFVGVRFDVPRTLDRQMVWKLANDTADGFFGTSIVMALMKHHCVIAQTSGHDGNVLDCTPPLVATEADIEYFAGALDQVLERSKEAAGTLWEMSADMMKRSMDSRIRLPALQPHGARSAPFSSV
jgi:ornithine--oxo-acid transaminase